ncbi:MAG: globin domain-containing protein [Pseudomonadota bacterium]
MLDQPTKELLRASIALLPTDAINSTAIFYERLFELAPEVRELFPADLSLQAQKLLDTLFWVVRYLNRPEELLPALHALGERHAGYNVKVDHYAAVGSSLLWMFQQCLGDQFTDDMEEAWINAYAFISAEMERGQRG